jgi:hypothetical protein
VNDVPPIRGLLSGLEDPEFMARLKARESLVVLIAARTGYDRRTAAYLLHEFETEPGENFGAMN